MGFFTKDDSPQAGALPRISLDRVAAILDASDSHYGWNDDRTEIGGWWDSHLFVFWLAGNDDEILQVRGRWARRVGPAERGAVLELLNAWSIERLWPKAYVEVIEDELVVFTEHSVDYEHGVTDKQIDQHVATGISSAIGLFDHLDEAYPDQASAARAEYEAQLSGD